MLDEFTNNLNMDWMEALGDALLRSQGAVIGVTHNQVFATRQIFLCRPSIRAELWSLRARPNDEYKGNCLTEISLFQMEGAPRLKNGSFVS
jgi:ATPase subunit of ABC transporter with duplicated ATPase domains